METKISYGMQTEQSISESAQYLMLKAGISSGVYVSEEFIVRLNSLMINELPASFDRCGELFEQRMELVKAAAMQPGRIVTIQNLNPAKLNSLEEIMRQPFE